MCTHRKRPSLFEKKATNNRGREVPCCSQRMLVETTVVISVSRVPQLRTPHLGDSSLCLQPIGSVELSNQILNSAFYAELCVVVLHA